MKKRYWLWNALILALVFGFTAWSIAKEQNFALLPRAFSLMRAEYIVAGALLSLWYVLCESIILKLMFWREKRRVSFLSCSRIRSSAIFSARSRLRPLAASRWKSII